MNRDQFIRRIDRALLGALADEGMPIGDCLDVIYRAWRGRDEDIVLPKDLGERVEGALADLNNCYDDNGYVIDAPAAHHAEGALCGVLDDVATVLDQTIVYRDSGEEHGTV